MTEPITLHWGNGGWSRVEGLPGLPGAMYFRVQLVDGRPRVTEMYLDGRGAPLAPAAVRDLPLASIEHWLTSDEALMSPTRLGTIGPDLSRLAAHYATTFGGHVRNWVADSLYAQFPGSGIEQVSMPSERRRPESAPLPEVVLEVPADRRLTDDFLADVGRAYITAIRRREAPALTIAKAAGVSPRTVHRWVYTARKRGIMPPAVSKGRIV